MLGISWLFTRFKRVQRDDEFERRYAGGQLEKGWNMWQRSDYTAEIRMVDDVLSRVWA